MANKKRKQQALPWCWYCDREFEDEKVLINHQKAKHFKCHFCHRKLNSGSGLVIHIAQLHKETIFKVPNAIEGHDTPEIEIYGMDGVPEEDLKRHREGQAPVPYKRSRLTEPGAGMLPLLAAQKASVPDMPANQLPSAQAPFPIPGGTQKPVSPPISSEAPAKKEAPGIVAAAPITYASPPMPPQYPPYGYAPPPPGAYYPPQYYPGYQMSPYYGAPQPYAYPPGYPSPYSPNPYPQASYSSPYSTVYPSTPYRAEERSNSTASSADAVTPGQDTNEKSAESPDVEKVQSTLKENSEKPSESS